MATTIAIPMEWLVSNANLALIYVLFVMFTGLKLGSRPAILASVLSFLSFDFFLTEPRYTFQDICQDELTILVFLLVIAVVCGAAASRIRHQLILLRESNRYLEAMRVLSQALTARGTHDL